MALARQAVGAPLPPGWDEDEETGQFLHESGTVSDAHPLDVYFLHHIQVPPARKRSPESQTLQHKRAGLRKAVPRAGLSKAVPRAGLSKAVPRAGPDAGSLASGGSKSPEL